MNRAFKTTDLVLVRVSCGTCGNLIAAVVRDDTRQLVLAKQMRTHDFPSGKVVHRWEREPLQKQDLTLVWSKDSTMQQYERVYCSKGGCVGLTVLSMEKLTAAMVESERSGRPQRWKTNAEDHRLTLELAPKMSTTLIGLSEVVPDTRVELVDE